MANIKKDEKMRNYRRYRDTVRSLKKDGFLEREAITQAAVNHSVCERTIKTALKETSKKRRK